MFNLGISKIGIDNFFSLSSHFYDLGARLNPKGYLSIYACETGKGNAGVKLVENISEVLRHPVYASNNVIRLNTFPASV